MDQRERTLVVYATAAHSLNHAYILLIPLLFSTWIQEFRTDTYVMGLVATAAYALFGGGSVPFGYLVDRIGSKPLLMLYLGGAALALVLLYFSRDLIQLTLGLGLLGLFSSTYHPSAIAMISREVREQGRGLGFHGMGGSLGIALGPLIASLLMLRIDWRTVLLLFSAPALVLLVSMALRGPVELAPRRPPTLKELTSSLGNYPFLMVLLVYVFAGVAYWGSLTFLPLYLDGTGLPPIRIADSLMSPASYLFPAILAVGAAGQVTGGILADRWRAEVTLAIMSVAVALLLVLLGFPQSIGVAVVALVFGFLLFALEPLQNILVSLRTPGAVRGVAFGLVFLSVFGIGGAGAALGGYVSATRGLSDVFPILAAFMVASGMAALLLYLKVAPPSQSVIPSSSDE